MSYGKQERWDRTVNVGKASAQYKRGQKIKVYNASTPAPHREEFEVVSINHANGELRLKRLPPVNSRNDK